MRSNSLYALTLNSNLIYFALKFLAYIIELFDFK
jgi:hypothetical protein